jgi:hypothetical protein
MKFASIALLATASAYQADEDENFALNIFGFNEGDFYDFENGFGNAIMHQDISTKWKGCIIGVPDFALSILDVYGGFDTSHPFTLMTNLANPSLAVKVSQRVMAGGLTAMNKMEACKHV